MTKEDNLGIKGRIISFRVNDSDNESITKAKEIMGGSIRRVTDADVIREGLKFIIAHKKIIKSLEENVIHSLPHEGSTEIGHTDDKNEISPNDDPRLTEEEWRLGYRYINGELCDSAFFPVDQMSGDVVIRNGEVYATEPRRNELKHTAEENMKEVIQNTEFGKANPVMEEMLATSNKVESLVVEPEESKHSETGMLATQDGVDESYDENNFI